MTTDGRRRADRARVVARRIGCSAARALAACAACAALLSPAQAQQGVTGTWHDAASGLVFQLHERADGTLLGYMPGGHPVVTGQVRGTAIHLAIETGDVERDRVEIAHGTVSGNAMTLTLGSGIVNLSRTAALFEERRFLAFPVDVTGNPDMDRSMLVRVAEGAAGFESGTFSALTFCEPFACKGDLASFTDVGGGAQVQIDLSWDGSCAGTASIDTTYDASSNFYQGTYSATDCSGDSSGNFALAAWHRTDTGDVAGVFASLGALADDMEAGAPFASPHASIETGFLHFSVDDADLRGDLGTQSAAYGDIDVQLTSFEPIHTVADPNAHPFLAEGFVARHRDERGGTGADGARRTVRRTSTDRNDGELSSFAEIGGTWILAGNQDPEAGGITLPFRVSDIRFDFFGWWAFGAHGGGHPEGHPGIDFELDGAATLVAVRSGTIVDIRNNDLTPDQVNVSLDVNGLEVKYQHVDATLAPGIFVGASVTAGQAIGNPGEHCCDPLACCAREGCAPGEEATCCATNYPGLGDCSPATNPDYHHLIHFGTVERVDSACPWDVMTPAARAELETFALQARYAEELTEPFICNDAQRNGDVMPYVTRWEKVTAVSPGNPPVVEMSRPDTYETHEFRFLDDLGAVTSQGLACAGGPEAPNDLRFLENAADCWTGGPGEIETLATFAIDATRETSTMTLALAGNGTDTYRAVVVDQGTGCPAGEVTGLTVDEGPAGLEFHWADDLSYTGYAILQSSTPDGGFAMPAAVATTGVAGATASAPGSIVYFKVAGRTDACGVGEH